MTEVDLPLAFPLYLLAATDGSAYLTAELSPGSIGLLVFRGRGIAVGFARDNGIGNVDLATIASAAVAVEAFDEAAQRGVTHVAVDPSAGKKFLAFPIRDFARRLTGL